MRSHALARQHHLGAAGARGRGDLPVPGARPIPGQPVVFGDRFPTETGRGRFVPADILPPDEVPDASTRWC
jgi:hypothetical protein